MTLSPTAQLIVSLLAVLLLLCIVIAVELLLLLRRKAPTVRPPSIPDSSDELQARQAEQHDLITAGGVIEKQLAQAIVTKRPQSEIDALIAQNAQNSKDVQRIGVEVSTSFQSRNLSTFMGRMDELGTQILGGQDAILKRVDDLHGWVDESRTHRAQMQEQINAIEAGMLPEGERERLMREHDELMRRVAAIERILEIGA